MTAWADHGADGNGEPLAIVLRAGNAGSNTAADHIEAARLALAQLPRHLRRRALVWADSGGGTHEFPDWLTARTGLTPASDDELTNKKITMALRHGDTSHSAGRTKDRG